MGKLISFISVVVGFIVWKATGNIIIGAVAGVVSAPLLYGIIGGIAALFSGKKSDQEPPSQEGQKE